MLISPQHFQQQDVYVDRLTTHKMFVSQPHYWGLTDIRISESGLRSNKIVIEKLQGVMRDGQIIELSEGDKLSAKLPEPKILDNGSAMVSSTGRSGRTLSDSILISIGVFRSGATSDDGIQQRPQQRFTSFNCTDVADENNANLTIDMRKKRVFVQIFVDEDIPGIYETMPLFRLKAGHNGYKLVNQHPPMIDARVSQALFADEGIWSKTEQMVAKIRNKAADMAGKSVSQSAEMQLMSMILSKLPAIEVLLKMTMVHPFQLYMAVVDLAAIVKAMSLSTSVTPFIPEGYDHDYPEKGFDEIWPWLDEEIDDIRIDWVTYAFTTEEPGRYEIELPEGVDLNEMIIKLVAEHERHSEEALKWIRNAKIGMDTSMQKLRKLRLRGLSRFELKQQRRQEIKLLETGAMVVLSNREAESAVTAKSTLQILGRRDWAPEKIYLYVPQPQAIRSQPMPNRGQSSEIG